MAIVGFSGTTFFASAFAEPQLMAMNLSYIIASIGVASMFVSQTVFLADIVDYGHVKQGFRSESITFSMKGFLQKMAYTIQTIILFSGLEISKYDETLHAANSAGVKSAISFMMLGAPIALFILSLLIFTFKFKLHGAYMDEITAKIKEIQLQSESDVK
jgi:Na+/melibiose symporter-like transporter